MLLRDLYILYFLLQLRVFRAPFAHVHFPDFFVADQLNSLNFMLPDLAYFCCFFSQYIDLRMHVLDRHYNLTLPRPGVNPIFSKSLSNSAAHVPRGKTICWYFLGSCGELRNN